MVKLVIGCSGAGNIAKTIAKKANLPYSQLEIKKFPDNELKIRFMKPVKGKEIILIQSFIGNISEKIIETLFAAYTLKDLGAKKIVLLAPYFSYFRQDTRFKSGESVSLDIIKKLFRQAPFNKLLIVEPHLHRRKDIKPIFPNGKRIQTAKVLSEFIKNNIKEDFVLVGPDEESEQWVKPIAKFLKKKHFILKKKRFTAHHVKIISKIPKHKEDTAVIIDDICSTGGTMLQTIKFLRKEYKKIYSISIHGLFVNDTLKKLRKQSTVLSTNSIPSPASKIDITGLLAGIVKNA